MSSEMPSRDFYDAIIIGGGHNGLTAAAYLGEARLSVLVLERRGILGGAASTEEVFPGFQVNTGAADLGLFHPRIVEELGLEKLGLQWIDSPALVFSPLPGGGGLTLWRDPLRTSEEIARFSPADARNYSDYVRLVNRLAMVLDEIATSPPFSVPDYKISELLPWSKIALKARLLGERDLMQLLRILPMPVYDLMNEWFENPLLKAALGSTGVTGSLLGPRAAGTAFMMLYHAMNAGEAGVRSSRFIRGGAGVLVKALAQAARSRGVEICTGVGVESIMLQENQATGVRLEGGQPIRGRMVVSSADPRQTFFNLVGASNLPVSFVRQVKHLRMKGSTARLNVALSGLPHFQVPGMSDIHSHLAGHITLCPNLDYLERASDQAKYGAYSEAPYLDVVIPTIMDSSLAPPGMHLMTVNVQYAPYTLRNSDWNQSRGCLMDTVMKTLSTFAPGIQELIMDCHLLTPLDLEREYGLTYGDIYHGQMGLDQLLFMRPVAGFGRYRTPVQSLYLCGAGAHPGGGVTGLPGRNAAREVLRDLGIRL
jgi:phytoene dehydrogenase-like protein